MSEKEQAILPRKGEITFSERGRQAAEKLAGRPLSITLAELTPLKEQVSA